MTKPCIICVDDEPFVLDALSDLLTARFGETHEIVSFTSGEEALAGLETLSREDREIPLILCDQVMPGLHGDGVLEIVHKRYPRILKVLLTGQAGLDSVVRAINNAGLNKYLQKPWETEALFLTVQSLLSQHELSARLTEHRLALEAKTAHLESLHQVGVALAGSFDIDSILHQIARAAAELVGDGPVDVFYTGSRVINARSRWLPQTPSEDNLPAASRHRLTMTIAAASESAGGSAGTEGSMSRRELAATLADSPGGEGRHLVTISQHGELLGLLIVKPPKPLGKEDEGLLAILTLQAATALHNVHLTQERIHFERLSAFGRMIGSLVHDFRSPLTAVRGYVSMLGDNDTAHAERREYATLAIEECDRLNSMINELLEFTRGGRSKLSFEPSASKTT